MKIAGLDIGTTGCKLTVFDSDGNYLGKAYREYPVKRSVGEHEANVAAIMDGVMRSDERNGCGFIRTIAGIGVTSFGETFVLTDEAGTSASSGNALHRSARSVAVPGIDR